MLGTITLAAVLLAQSPPDDPSVVVAAEIQEAKHLTNVRQVTSGLLKAGEGYFRPDGQAIIYQGVRPGTEDYQIFTQDLTPGSAAKLVSTGRGKCTCAYYHPDGRSILFASSHLDPALDSEGKAEPAVKPPGYNREGRSYRWDFEPAMDIFRADLDGSNLVRLTDSPGYDAEGSYSPDGKRIVFTSFRDDNDAEIYIMDADGKNPRRITHVKGYDGGPFFSPDGKKLVYRSDRKGNDLLQVFVNNIEGTAERALTGDDQVNWGPYWHPDNRHVIYATSRYGHTNYDLLMVDSETGTEERITYRPGFDGLPVFSPDGTKLLWTSSGRTPDKKSQLFLGDFRLGPDLPVDQ